MSGAAIFTIALVALLVAALAFYLIWVIAIVTRVNDTLGKITFGVRAIAHRTGPVAPALRDVNGNLDSVANALENLVAKAEAGA